MNAVLSALSIKMHDPEGTILREIADGFPQRAIAVTYAFLIAQKGDAANWPLVNSAIRGRWAGLTALKRIKTQAWKHVEDWRNAAAMQGVHRA